MFSLILKDERFSIERIQSEIKHLNERLNVLISQNKFSDPEYIDLNQQLAKKNKLLEDVIRYTNLLNQLEQAKELQNDADLAQIAEDEIKSVNLDLDKLYKEFIELTLPKLPNDELKAIIEFRPGVGGVEASLFAEDLMRIYLRYCNTQGFSVEMISLEYDEQGIKEAIMLVNNTGAFGNLRFESGVHRVQRIPSTESSGRIHTSTASLVVMPKFDTTSVEINQDELRIDVYRSSGPGGQSVNTTDSAVRITHLPTGIVVSCQNGKSQHKNKEMAMSILLSKLQEIEDDKRMSEEKKTRTASIKDGDRSAKIRTYNFQQSRVTDHRIGQSWFNLDAIMNGEIEDIVKTVNTELRKELVS